MSINVKIKNATGQPIAIGGGDPYAAGKEAEVSLDAVRSTELAEHLAGGSVVFPRGALDGLPVDARADAGQAIAELVLRVAPRFLAHHGELVASLANLAALRDRYNEAHGSTVRLLAAVGALRPGLEAVIQAADLLSAAEDDAVAAAGAALDKHLTQLPKQPEELAAWYIEHKRLEAARDAAVVARASTRSVVARQLEATRAELGTAAAAFGKADPKTDVGASITWGP